MNNNSKKTEAITHGLSSDPIFIHSLWRTGSTYIYEVFRRSDNGYWCYQEPVHEVVLCAKNNPDNLLSFVGDKMLHLRHPTLSLPYFWELYETWEYWHEHIAKYFIYDGYFEETCGDDLKNYLSALFKFSKGRPVIQECRTSCRIKALKNAFNGIHLYLWRNPWDQWWSFKVTDYFNIALQLVLNAPVHPTIISRLRNEIGFVEFHDEDVFQELGHFDKKRMSAPDNYLVFYTLWCLGLLEGIANSTLLINIDSLSDSKNYNKDIIDILMSLGVSGLDFTDSSVHQTIFTEQEISFFIDIEDRVHGLMLASGYSQSLIDRLIEQRRTHEPKLRITPLSEVKSVSLLTDAKRAREIVIRYESAYSARLHHSENRFEDECKQHQFTKEELFRQHQELVTLQHTMSRREKEFDEKVFTTRQSVESEKANLQRMFFEHEQSIRQEFADRENALQVKHDKLLYTLARREQEFGEKLYNEKAEQLRLYVEQEKTMQQQYEQLRQTATKLEEHLKQEITALNAEICTMRSSLSWKITAPFRKLLNFISLRRLRSLSEPTETFNHFHAHYTVGQSAQINESAEKQLISERISMSNLVRLEKTAAARNIDELLSTYDEKFVRSAYLTLLGRAPDPNGMKYYLLRLRRGVSKIEIINQICSSAEGKVRNTDVAGLQDALNQYQWGKVPIIGSLLSMLGLTFSEPDIKRRLRIIENQLAIISDKSDYLREIDKRLSAIDDENNKRFNKVCFDIKKLHSLFLKYGNIQCSDASTTSEKYQDENTYIDDTASSIVSKPIVFHSEQPDEVIKELTMHVRRSSEAVQISR